MEHKAVEERVCESDEEEDGHIGRQCWRALPRSRDSVGPSELSYLTMPFGKVGYFLFFLV